MLKRLLLGAALGLLSAGSAWAESFPARPVKIVVPFAAGAINDTVARLVAEHLQRSFPSGVVVENRAGAGGMIGSEFVAKAPPDGYTLLLSTDDAISVMPAVRDMPYNVATDFQPLVGIAHSAFGLSARASLPVRSFDELLKAAKAKPDSFKYASTGAGGLVHVGTALLEDLAGIRLTHVPYRGMAPAVTDVIGDHVDLVVVSPATIAPHVQSGKVRVLALADDKRHPMLPDVPTSAELGYPDFLVRSTIGVLAPKGVPLAVAQRLSSELARIAGDKGFQDRLIELGISPAPLDSGAYAARIAAETVRWSALAKRAQLKVDK